MFTVLRSNLNGISKFDIIFSQQSSFFTKCIKEITFHGKSSVEDSWKSLFSKPRRSRSFTRYGRPSEKAPKLTPQQVGIVYFVQSVMIVHT